MSDATAGPPTPTVAKETFDTAPPLPEPDYVDADGNFAPPPTDDMAPPLPEPDYVDADGNFAPPPTDGMAPPLGEPDYVDADGNFTLPPHGGADDDQPDPVDPKEPVDITEWIVEACTGFFGGDEETIRTFGEDPEGWCGTNLPPDCGPQDISRCMPEIMERCGQSGGDSESGANLARYCGTFSQNSSSTYHENSSSGGSSTTYSSGSHCACDTVVNEICYTVNVYHQTNIYTHVEGGTTTTGCFGDRTPCTTTDLDEDFGCTYPEEFPTWDPDAPIDSWETPTGTDPMMPEGTETPGMAPPMTGQTQEKAPAAESADEAAGTIDMTPSPGTMMPGRAEPKPEEPKESKESVDQSAPTPVPEPAAEAVEPPMPAFGQGSTPEETSLQATETTLDSAAETTATSAEPAEDLGFGQGSTADPIADSPDPVETPVPDPVVEEITASVAESVPETAPEPVYEASEPEYVPESEAAPNPADEV